MERALGGSCGYKGRKGREGTKGTKGTESLPALCRGAACARFWRQGKQRGRQVAGPLWSLESLAVLCVPCWEAMTAHAPRPRVVGMKKGGLCGPPFVGFGSQLSVSVVLSGSELVVHEDLEAAAAVVEFVGGDGDTVVEFDGADDRQHGADAEADVGVVVARGEVP